MMMQWTKHPTIPTPDKGRLKALLDSKGAQAVYEVWKAREDAIKLTIDDPLRHGVNLVSWDRIRWALSEYNEVLVLGGNRGAKTTGCLLYTSPSPRDGLLSRMPSSA